MALTGRPQGRRTALNPPVEHAMTWTKPAFTELRFGFEITMYIQNR